MGGFVKEIVLTRGQVAIVDDEDFERLNQFKWYAHLGGGRFYGARNDTRENGYSKIYLHREVVGAKAGDIVDHIDQESLHDWRSNLRVCDRSRNALNHRRYSNNTTGYIGVAIENGNSFRAYRYINGRTIFGGLYKDIIECAKKSDEIAKEFHGEFAVLNFPA